MQFQGDPAAFLFLGFDQSLTHIGQSFTAFMQGMFCLATLAETGEQGPDEQRFYGTNERRGKDVPFIPLPQGRFAKLNNAAGGQQVFSDVPAPQFAPVENVRPRRLWWNSHTLRRF